MAGSGSSPKTSRYQATKADRSLRWPLTVCREAPQDPPLAEVALFCLGALQRLAEREEAVGRPFQVAVLSERRCWILSQS